MLTVSQPTKGPKQLGKERGIKRSSNSQNAPESPKKRARKAQDFTYRNKEDRVISSTKKSANGFPAREKYPEKEDNDSSDTGSELSKDDTHQHPQKADGTLSEAKESTRGSGKPAASSGSREAHQKQKVLTKERKELKPNADVLTRAKQVWEVFRAPNLPKDKKRKHTIELLEIIGGRAKDFVFKHDGARIFQAAWTNSKAEEKRGLARELKGQYLAMAESKYAKHILDKMLSFTDSEIRALAIAEFYGHVRHMIRGEHAGWALDDAYRGAATKQQKARLLREWYGAEFAIFKNEDEAEPTSDLKTILKENPEKRQPIMRYLFEIINLLLQKQTWRFEMLHDAMLQYYMNLTPNSEEWERFFELILEDDQPGTTSNLALVLSETRSGSRLLALIFAHSTAKNRKLLLRKFKDNMVLLASHENAHVVILSALEVIDDTVLTTKAIYGEIIADWKKIEEGAALISLQQRYLRAILLLPFVHKDSLILPPPQVSFLFELHDLRRTTSKKDPAMRRTELAQYLAPYMFDAITAFAPDLLANNFTSVGVQEVVLNGPSNPDAKREEAFSNVLVALESLLLPAEDAPQDPDEDVQAKIESPAATRTLKFLILGGWYNPQTDEVEASAHQPHFASQLASNFLAPGKDGRDELLRWATGVRAFLVEALLRTEDMDADQKKGLKTALQKRRKEIQACAAEQVPEDSKGNSRRVAVKGAQAVLAALDRTG